MDCATRVSPTAAYNTTGMTAANNGIKTSPLAQRDPNIATSSPAVAQQPQKGLPLHLQAEINAFADKVLQMFAATFLASIADSSMRQNDELLLLEEKKNTDGSVSQIYLNTTKFGALIRPECDMPEGNIQFKRIFEAVTTSCLSILFKEDSEGAVTKFISEQNRMSNGTKGNALLKSFIFKMLSSPSGIFTRSTEAFTKMKDLREFEAKLNAFGASPTLKNAMLHVFKA